MKKGYQKSTSNSTVKLGFTGEMPESKPTLYLTDKDLPDIKSWNTGETYKLEITVKQVSKSEHTTSSGKETTASFDITNISVDNDSDDNEEED